MDIKKKRQTLRVWLLCIMTLIPFFVIGIISYLHAINWGIISYFLFFVYAIFLGVPYIILCLCISWIVSRLVYRDNKTSP